MHILRQLLSFLLNLWVQPLVAIGYEVTRSSRTHPLRVGGGGLKGANLSVVGFGQRILHIIILLPRRGGGNPCMATKKIKPCTTCTPFTGDLDLKRSKATCILIPD